MSKQLHIINESCFTTFRSSRGASNIDLTVINNQALDSVRDWVVSDQESCSDNSIIKYVIGNSRAQLTEINTEEVMYKVTKEDREIPAKPHPTSEAETLQNNCSRKNRKAGRNPMLTRGKST
jgi:hypothetical protein